MHARRCSNSLGKLALAGALVALASCQSLERRHDPKTSQGGSSQTPSQNPRSNQPVQTQPQVEFPEGPVTTTPTQPVQVAPPVVNLPPPPKSNIKVGVIVGPGGMKSFAALGVFREMNRARIPIHAIAGLEWGAVIGGLYASQGQINDAEWKAFKLREENLPEAGFLTSAKSAPVSKLNSFMDAAFAGLSTEKSRIDFACATSTKGSEKVGWLNRGSMKSAVERCLPYPPMFQIDSAMASPFSVEDSANWLRSRGANVILLIDVLGQGDILPGKNLSETSPENILWGEIRREMYRAKAPTVNHVIHVNTAGHPVTDFNGRRSLMDAGAKAATDVCNKMVSQYGF